MGVVIILALATFFTLMSGTLLCLLIGYTAIEIFCVWIAVIVVVIFSYLVANLILLLSGDL